VHELGDHAFEQTFVSNPAPVNGGLGPLFNNVSCISCHHNDGKGTPTAGQSNSSLLFRMSLPGLDNFGGPNNVPGYGGQLQDMALQGRTPEAKMDISYQPVTMSYDDGTQVQLRKPVYTMRDAYLQLPSGCMVSPRMAPPVFGLGLLELISQTMLEAMADAADADGDGISGRPNYVYNPLTKKMEAGRFGLKAGVPTIELQVAAAYNQDMGVTNHIFPVESSFGQPQADGHDYGIELPDSIINAVSFYIKTLSVPARRDVADPSVQRGEQLFATLHCGSCHRPTLRTEVDVRFPQLSNQRASIPILICCCMIWARGLQTIVRTSAQTAVNGAPHHSGVLGFLKKPMAFPITCTMAGPVLWKKLSCGMRVKPQHHERNLCSSVKVTGQICCAFSNRFNPFREFS
jgi:CxxC motif-containing protein (DUF1111 family)